MMPFCYLLRLPVIQLLLFGFGAAFLYFACTSLNARPGFGLSRHHMYRLVSFGDEPVGSHVSFNLLFEGCKVKTVDAAPCSNISDFGPVCLIYPQPIHMNGFELLSSENLGLNVSHFEIQGSDDGGSTWQRAGSSSFRWVRNGVRFLQHRDREGRLRFDTRAPWPLTIILFVDFLVGIVLPIISVCGIIGRVTIAKATVLVLIALIGLSYATAAVGYLAAISRLESVLYFNYALLSCFSVTALQFREKYLFEVAMTVGALGILARVITDCACFSDCDWLRQNPPALQLFLMLCGTVLAINRKLEVGRLLDGVDSDRGDYEAEWLRIKSMQDGEALRNLENRVSTISRFCTAGQARHYHRQAQNQFESTKRLIIDHSQNVLPVSSLQQVYVQAVGLVNILHGRCDRWASQHGGSLKSANINYSAGGWLCEICGPSCESWIHLGYVKRPERALAKLLLRYQNDPSKVVDVCRHRIIFDSIQELDSCLAAIEGDPSIMIVRIKSSLCERENIQMKGGFKAVILNLRIYDSETRRLGLEYHVCELQLLLRATDFLQDQIKHARYVEFRDALSKREFAVTGDRRSSIAQLLRVESGEGESLSSIQIDLGRVQRGSSSTAIRLDAVSESYHLSHTAYQELYVWSVLEPADSLHRMLFTARHAMHRSSVSSAMFTSEPLVAMMAKRVFRIFLVLMSLYCIAYLFMALYPVEAVSEYPAFQYLRVSIHDTSNQSLQRPSIAAFYLLSGPDSCRLDSVFANISKGIDMLNLSLTSPIAVNGYYIETDTVPVNSGERHIGITIQASNNNGRTWIKLTDGVLSESTDDSGYVKWRLQGSSAWVWMWYVRYAISVIVGLVGFSSAFCFSVMGRETRAAAVLLMTLWLYAACFLVALAGFCSQARYRDAVQQVTYLGPFLTLSTGLTFYQSRAIAVLLVFGTLHIVLSVYRNLGVPRLFGGEGETGGIAMVIDVMASPGTIALTFGIFVLIFRRFALERARRLICADQERYNSVWEDVSRQPGAEDSLRNLQEQVERLEKCMPNPHAVIRQLHRRPAARSEANTYGTGVVGTCDAKCPVRNLSTLYFQARCMHSIFLDKARRLAVASGGGGFAKMPRNEAADRCSSSASINLCVNDDGNFIFVKCCDVPQAQENIRWSQIKSTTRSVEKLVRSYRQDVSRLVDVCRQQIIFEDLNGLLRCVEAIVNDEDIVVLRVKNRFHRGYDSACTAGYRDVAMNLRIVNEESKKLGVETHVCELQLALISFASIKSNEGHQRYVSFRNLRGE